MVAVPEELFFRGYLYSRLEQRWPSTRRFLGAPVGRTLLVTSALFALGHVLVDFNVQRLAVFFPALVFGWMRARTGSVAAGAVFHALCNLYSDVLHTSFFRTECGTLRVPRPRWLRRAKPHCRLKAIRLAGDIAQPGGRQRSGSPPR